jgi:hypothetical protein
LFLRLIGVLAALLLGSAVLVAPSAQAVAPPAPTGLEVFPQTNNGPLVLWLSGPQDGSISQYVVERSSNNQGFGIIGTRAAFTTSSVISLQDFAPPPAGSVVYRVRAVNSAGESSGYATAAPLTINAPAGRSFAGPLTVNFATSAPAGAVARWSFEETEVVGATASHTFTALGTYLANVRVDRIAPDGVYEYGYAEFLITVTEASLPLAVANDLRATSPRRGQVRLTWTNPPSSATMLQINRVNGTPRRSTQVTRNVGLTQTSYLDTTVRSGTRYTYTLTASDGRNTVFSNSVVITAR